MQTTLLVLIAVALVANTLYMYGELRALRRDLDAMRLDVAEITASTQEAYSVLVDMAMEDAAGDAEWTFDITETNGVVHE